MFDIKAIRDNPELFDRGLAKRGVEPFSTRILALDEERRALIGRVQEAQTKRNEASKLIGKAKASGDEAEARRVIEEVAALKDQLQKGEDRQRWLDQELSDLLAAIPNIPLDDVPIGEDEDANVQRHTHGERREFNFSPKEHFDLGEDLGLMDFETAAKMSGSRFVVLKGALARMERALASFMLDIHVGEFGYEEIAPPLLVRDEAVFGTSQLPKFAEDLFKTENGHWLIPTAEVPLTNLVRESILDGAELPKRFTAFTPCFRSEAGSAGKDTRGMIRLHQFNKVEMVAITTRETSNEELERMLTGAETVLQRLELPYRVMTLSTGDMGFAAQKTYDIEVWLPGQDSYREISSISVCGDFQARRMNARYRVDGEKKTHFVHTLNGSGLAIGRTIVAIMENYQQADGSIAIPEALQPYMGGRETIAKDD